MHTGLLLHIGAYRVLQQCDVGATTFPAQFLILPASLSTYVHVVSSMTSKHTPESTDNRFGAHEDVRF
jgi:hypothetical protein